MTFQSHYYSDEQLIGLSRAKVDGDFLSLLKLHSLDPFFLFECFYGCPINICEMKSFLYNHSIWDARKQIF